MVLYADHETDAIKELLRITKGHREKQIKYNEEHGITPHSVKRAINESAYVYKSVKASQRQADEAQSLNLSTSQLLEELTRDMLEASDNLEFERAAYLRDQIKELKKSR